MQLKNVDLCQCDECIERDHPCSNDCNIEDPCTGCRNLAEERAEAEFEADCAFGRK